MYNYTGYHGTSQAKADKIVENRFVISTKPNEWLGTGIYFFGSDGEIDGQVEARCWARHVKQYSRWAVIKATLRAEKVLDLVCNVAHKKLYDILQRKCYEAHIRSGKDAATFSDYMIFNDIDENYDFEIICAHTEGSKNKFTYNSYVVRRLQIQICVKNEMCIREKFVCEKGGT